MQQAKVQLMIRDNRILTKDEVATLALSSFSHLHKCSG